MEEQVVKRSEETWGEVEGKEKREGVREDREGREGGQGGKGDGGILFQCP